MSKIHFVVDLFDNTWQIIKESHDCLDVANDLRAIQNTISFGSDLDAGNLDSYLRRKYPAIEAVLKIAYAKQVQSYSLNSSPTFQFSCKSRLQEDFWGIICQTAVNKGLKQNLEACIDYVEA